MSYWMVDLRDRVAQRVTEDADTPEPNDRFFKVEADSVQEAIDKAEKARTVYNKLNDLDAIEAWVKSQPDGAIVGYVNHQCKCPLSYYLAANGFQNVQIGNLFDLSTFRVGKDDSSQFLPDIASGIAAYVDDERLPDEAYEKDADPSLRQPPVTKERMLEIIAEARTWDLT